MPILTGTIDDVTGSPIADVPSVRVTVKAPSRRSSLAEQARLVASVPVPVEVSPTGEIAVELEPGPAVMLVEGEGLRDVYELGVTADMTLLTEALQEMSPTRSWVESQMVQLRAATVTAAGDAQAAKSDAETAAGDAETHRTHVDAIRDLLDEAAQNNVAPYLTPTELNATYVPGARVGGLAPAPLIGATVTNEGSSNPRAIAVFDGYMWGCVQASLRRSFDYGRNWETVAALPASPATLRPTADGEVLFTSGPNLYKSTGWSINPATATYRVVLTATPGATFLPFGFDGDEIGRQKFIITEYGSGIPAWAASRYVWISLDAGQTWTVVYDSDTDSGGAPEDSHMHGACYDRWADRFWWTEGHGVGSGYYYSDDDGATHSMLPKNPQFDTPAATVLVATDDGIVCGSDNHYGGLYGIPRTDDPADMQLIHTWRWRPPEDGTAGFGNMGFRDPDTGVVYIAFGSVYTSTKPMIAGGTATTGALVWEAPTAGAYHRVWEVVVSRGRMRAHYEDATGHRVVQGVIPKPGVPAPAARNRGNIEGGIANQQTSVAFGPGAYAGDTPYAVVGGAGATAKGLSPQVVFGLNAKGDSNNVVIGPNADTEGGGRSVAIGPDVKSKFSFGVGIGDKALNSASYSTSVGAGAQAGSGCVSVGSSSNANLGASATAAGHGSKAEASAAAFGHASSAAAFGASFGKNSAVTVANGAAFGFEAVAMHLRSVALGANTLTTASDQVQIGPRHIEFAATANPPAPAAGRGDFYLFDNAGTLELRVRTATGIRKATLEAVA